MIREKNEVEFLTQKINKYQENVWEIFPDATIQYFNDGLPRVISSTKDISAYTEFGVQMMKTPKNEETAWEQAASYTDFIRAYNKVIESDSRLIEEFIRK